MNGLSDALTIGILLVLVFGAVSFYLYSRLSQNEKRVSLLENLLLTLKMNTEASLEGPDMVEMVGSPVPISADDVETVSEEEYADLLKDLPVKTSQPTKTAEEDAEELLRSLDTDIEHNTVSTETNSGRSMDVNYESMSVKELRTLAKERGLSGIPQNKSAIIDLLKKKGGAAPSTVIPLTEQEGEFDGAKHESGYTIEEL
jgi:hypothetical protein